MSGLRPRNVTKRLPTMIAVLLLGALLLPLSTAAASDAKAGDASAVTKAGALLEALGGKDAYDNTRFIRFNFFGFRTHHWDRWTGRYRLEGQNRAGEHYVVLFDVHSKDGVAFKDGAAVEGEEKAQMLQMGYGAFINDTYWLLMPYKLLDPGVTLHDAGEETLDGKVHDVVKLTFGDVGMTPGDTYWAYIDRDSGLMTRWAYHLEGWEADREKTAWDWTGWTRHGGIMLSPVRRNVDSGDERGLEQIAIFDSLDDSVFESPEAIAAE